MSSKNIEKLKIGGHVSMSGGLDRAVERAAEIGGNCFQLFSGSPRSWARKDLAEFAVDSMLQKREELAVDPVFTHALYLINLASDNSDLVDKSIQALIYDLRFDSRIKGGGVVVHLGSHQGRGWEQSRQFLADIIKKILEKTPADSTLLIENSAGQRGKIASNLAEIKWLLDAVSSKRLGWCFDTCHAFAAGYFLANSFKESSLSEDKIKEGRGEVMTEIADLKLWPTLKCIHINDSLTEFASGNDRHANIGEGLIPKKDLRQFLSHPKVREIPWITEVPGMDGEGPDQENIKRIRELASS